MAHLSIDSIDDPWLAPYRDIRHRIPKEHGDRFIAEGALVVDRLLASRHRCESILVQHNHHRELVHRAAELPQPPAILSTDPETLRQLLGFPFHRGILACGRHTPVLPLEQLAVARLGAPVLIICGVSDPENVGGLLRTAAAFGIEQVVLTPNTANPYSRRVLRVSVAAGLKMQFFWAADLARQLGPIRESLGLRCLATTLDDRAQSLADFVHDRRPLAVLVGSEATGLPEKLLDQCTDWLTIPMRHGVDSLNANVATALFLYHLSQITPPAP